MARTLQSQVHLAIGCVFSVSTLNYYPVLCFCKPALSDHVDIVNGNDDPVIVPVYRDASLDEPSQVSTAADSEESASHNQLHRFNGAASARVNGSTPFNGDMASGSGTLNGGLTNGFHNSDMVV